LDDTNAHIHRDNIPHPPLPTQPIKTISEILEIVPRPNYHLDVILDTTKQVLRINEIIGYTNNTGESQTELLILVPPAHHRAAFHLDALVFEPAFSQSTVSQDGAELHLNLVPALDTGREITIQIQYELRPPRSKGAFGVTPSQLCLADWYPFIPPYLRDRGWLIRSPGVVGEYLAYPLSDVTVQLTVLPEDESLIIAASAPHTAHDNNRYTYFAQNVRNFYLAISANYHIASAHNDQAAVMVYTYPEHAYLAQRAADLALQAWETFTLLYGSNPRQFASIVETDIDDGLEGDGLVYLSDFYFTTADYTSMNYFELMVVHEISHQWIYGMIYNDQANEPWLDETLATYSEFLFYEIHHPELASWWWDYRVNYYDPDGFVNATIYDFNAYRPYVNTIYLQGANFIDALRSRVGEDSFKSFLYNYVQSEGNDFRDAAIFFEILSHETDMDIATVKSLFFRETQ